MLSPFLFLLVIDWVWSTSTAQTGNGIYWTPLTQLDDLDFADDLALLSHTQRQMQEKTSTVPDNSARLGLRVQIGKYEVPKNNAAVSTMPTTLDGDGLEDVTSFTYPGSVVDKQGWGRGRGWLMPM